MACALFQKVKIEKITTNNSIRPVKEIKKKELQIVPDVDTGSTHKDKNVLLTIVRAKFARKLITGQEFPEMQNVRKNKRNRTQKRQLELSEFLTQKVQT